MFKRLFLLLAVLAAAWLNPLLETAEQVAVALNLPLAGAIPRSTLTAAALSCNAAPDSLPWT